MSTRLAVGGLRTDGFGLSSPLVELIATPDELTFRGRLGLSRLVFRTRRIRRDRVSAIGNTAAGRVGGTGLMIRGNAGERWVFYGLFERSLVEEQLRTLGYPVE